jgi:UDP-glucose 4-epimerase
MRVFVTGAAGFIGSVVTEQLLEKGHDVIAFDNLSTGHRAAVHPDAKFVLGDLLDADGLHLALTAQPVDAVVHLAAEALIGVSNVDPGRSFRINVVGGLNLLEAMVAAKVRRMVFSSSAAVYGTPENIPIVETDRLDPINAYGDSKLAFERMLIWYGKAHDFRYACLRYFNACGASESRGEDREEETHIIPVAFEVAMGQRDHIELYGTDYETRDGTCVRDYVHVVDIARAHLLVLEQLDQIKMKAYNLGTEIGRTNREVLDAVARISGLPVNIKPVARRPGDPDALVASASAIKQDLGWKPLFSDLDSMIESSWRWRRDHPQGYAK